MKIFDISIDDAEEMLKELDEELFNQPELPAIDGKDNSEEEQ